jgi:uncharacterized membrane protein
VLTLLRSGLNPFDPRTVFLARHAQHVVLVHFPIALFTTAVMFDVLHRFTKRPGFADAAYYNLFVAAVSTVPVVVTGALAWRFQLEGQKIKGVLLLHLVVAAVATVLICTVWGRRLHIRRKARSSSIGDLGLEIVAMIAIAVTAHLGGFLSGVNGPG